MNEFQSAALRETAIEENDTARMGGGITPPNRGLNAAVPGSAHGDSWIGFNQLQKKVKKSRSTIYRWIGRGLLPEPVKGRGATHNMWRESEVCHFLLNEFR